MLHLNIHLVDTETSVTLWSETYDFTYEELGDAHARVSASVASALSLRLSSHEIACLSARSTDVVKAYEFYLRGVGLLATNQEKDLSVALSMLTRATELDETYSDAHASRGYALWRKYFCGWDADVRTLQLGLDSAARAITLDPRSTSARMTRIRIYWDMGWHEQALAEGYLCCEHNSTNLNAVLALARAYNNAGMADLCLPLTRHVLQMDPSNRTASKLLIWSQVMLADYVTACSVGERYVQAHPEDTNTPWAVCMAQLHLGNFAAAAELADRVLRSDRSNFTMWLLLGHVHRVAGDEERARRVWASSIEPVHARLASFRRNYRARAWVANLEAGAGLHDQAAETIRSVRAAEPANAYLLYRLAHASAELGLDAAALDLFRAAIHAGFLSVQMMRCEELCSFRHLVDDPRYQTIASNLEDRVETLKTKYSRGSPMVD
jgi:tetratricopeptide (TPR) repeat protein